MSVLTGKERPRGIIFRKRCRAACRMAAAGAFRVSGHQTGCLRAGGKRRPVFSELSGGARRSGRRRRRSFRKFNQNNVVANLTDGFPGNDDVFFSAQDAAEFGRTRYDQRDNPSGDAVEIYVCRTAQRTAAADIDNFFLLQVDQAHEKSPFFPVYD